MKTIVIDGREVEIERMDITGEVRSLYANKNGSIPMYSYDGPAYNFWNGIAKGMAKNGATIEEIKWWLQSKGPRRLLDSISHNVFQKLGEKYGKDVDISYIKENMKTEEII